jgi:surface protein
MKNESKKIIDKYEENIEKLMKEINILKEELDKKDEIYKNELINMKNEYDMKISLKKEKYDKEMMKLNNNYQKVIEDKEREIKFNENKLRKLKEENMNNIKKFEAYLKVLEKRISFVNNEITIIYEINKNENFVKIFDEDFVKAKKDFCKILYEGKEYELQENFDIKNINKNSDLLEIKLKITKKITSFFSMFYKCKSLLFLPDISKFDTSNIVNMNDMFCECSSLIFLSDISKWNTSKLERTAEMFYGCSSLTFLLIFQNGILLK